MRGRMPVITDIALGPFLIGDVIGRGGAGVVRRGIHVESRVPIAVKLLGEKRTPTALLWLENEVRQVARLSHQNIIHVLDYGIVDEKTARRSKDLLPAGSPYLVMEHASGGSLDRVQMPVPFTTAIDTMLSLLAGLAHAHARGVVHRDLKPSNVLLSTSADERPGLKISDFGLALDVRHDEAVQDGGTPLYMAPEQFVGGRAGPEVDIYAAGCILFQLLVGRPPFVEGTHTALMLAHVESPVPELHSVEEPDALNVVLSRFLAKAPEDRYRSAADAAHALHRLVRGRAKVGLPVALESLGAATFDAPTGTTAVFRDTPARDVVSLANDVTRKARSRDVVHSATPSEGTPTIKRVVHPEDVPPFPSTWRVAGEDHHRKKLHDAGLSLFGLRTTPFVGREDERDVLWSLLGRVRAERRPRVVIVRGPSGTGKSRLASWLVERAVELGAARAVTVSVPDAPGAQDALGAAFARALHVSPRSSTAELDLLHAWHREVGDGVSRDELRALLLPSETDAEGARGFRSSTERHAATLRLLTALGMERPVILFVDDIARSPDLLAIARALFATDRDVDVPVLLVGTAAEEELAIRTDTRPLIDALAGLEGASLVQLDALDPASHATLVDGLLGLDPDTAALLRTRTSGNPLYLVNIISDWIERGALEVGAHGYTLRADQAHETPSGTFALWEQRVSRAIDGEAARHALEIAAVLGARVELFEWSAVLKEVGIAPQPDLPGRLASLGLALVDDDGFRFVHAMVREAIERYARASDRMAGHHRAAARALIELYGKDALGMAGRIGRHLILAGEGSDALAPLSSGAEQLFARGEAFAAEELLVLWRETVQVLALADDDPRVLPGLILEARVYAHLGHTDAARGRVHRANAAAERTADRALLADSLLIESAIELGEGSLPSAQALAERARVLSATHDPLRHGTALRMLGDVAYYRGERDRALEHYGAAMALFRETHERGQLAVCLWSRGYVLMGRGEYVEAERLFRAHLDIARKDGDRFLESNAQNALGELMRRQGKHDDAERRYKTAIRLASATGSAKRFVYRLNVAHTYLARGDVAAARHIAEEAIGRLAEVNDRLGVCSGSFVLAACAIARDDVATFERELARAIDIERGLAFVDDDMAIAAEAAAAGAREKGRLGGARLAYTFARDKWKALGEQSRVDAIEKILDEIPAR
jgi:serine/threonine protein kinase/tetratricopeptide (TPR) repeat protein